MCRAESTSLDSQVNGDRSLSPSKCMFICNQTAMNELVPLRPCQR